MKKVHTKTVPRSSRRSYIELITRKEKNGVIETLVHIIMGILKIHINQEYRKDLKSHKRSKTATFNNKKTETKGVKVQEM